MWTSPKTFYMLASFQLKRRCLFQGPSIELNLYWFYEYLPPCRDVKNRAVWLKKAKPHWKISERRPTQECRTSFPLILPYFFSIPLTETELRVWPPVVYLSIIIMSSNPKNLVNSSKFPAKLLIVFFFFQNFTRKFLVETNHKF